tara:strand:+ start:828 stop:1250 length:423 start_codon:yes stop_codon:yes gene_type:complete
MLVKTKTILDQKTIGLITTFEKITRTSVIELLERNKQLIFIVKEKQAGKAVGKAGSNIKRLILLLKKKIKVVEFSENPEKFLKNLISPIIPESITKQNTILTIKTSNPQDKGKLMGRERQNLKFISEILLKYHKLDVKVA